MIIVILFQIKNDYKLFKKIIIKCNIDFDSFDNIKNNIIKTCVGNYKNKYCIEYKLILIFQLINDYTNWKALHKCIFYESFKNTKNHYKIIYKQYKHWNQKGIFKNSLHSVFPVDINDKNDKNIIINNDFYNIDVKNVTKLSIISDVDGFVFSVSLSKSKKKKIKYNGGGACY